ncbi:hypothetical protein [Streptomyces sp. NPDC005181]|uniref:hypothetical protein n=1 Tax=Streptomyces sp. NPDC005181 TaxID=3156869 RepID=UPI0033B657AB
MSSALTMAPVPQDKKKDIAPDGIDPVGHVITYADSPGGTSRDVAYPERELPPGGIPAYLEARRGGVRSFVLWADPQRRTRLATLVTTSAADGVATYQVLGAHAEWCDWRLGAALVALLRSFDSWLGTPWDDRRK